EGRQVVGQVGVLLEQCGAVGGMARLDGFQVGGDHLVEPAFAVGGVTHRLALAGVPAVASGRAAAATPRLAASGPGAGRSAAATSPGSVSAVAPRAGPRAAWSGPGSTRSAARSARPAGWGRTARRPATLPAGPTSPPGHFPATVPGRRRAWPGP